MTQITDAIQGAAQMLAEGLTRDEQMRCARAVIAAYPDDPDTQREVLAYLVRPVNNLRCCTRCRTWFQWNPHRGLLCNRCRNEGTRTSERSTS